MTGSRPSQLLTLHNTWVAWCIDHNISLFGRVTEEKLSQLRRDGKPRYKLADLLRDETHTDKPSEPRKITSAEMLAMGLPVKLPIQKT